VAHPQGAIEKRKAVGEKSRLKNGAERRWSVRVLELLV